MLIRKSSNLGFPRIVMDIKGWADWVDVRPSHDPWGQRAYRASVSKSAVLVESRFPELLVPIVLPGPADHRIKIAPPGSWAPKGGWGGTPSNLGSHPQEVTPPPGKYCPTLVWVNEWCGT